jgi:hypothetical protein
MRVTLAPFTKGLGWLFRRLDNIIEELLSDLMGERALARAIRANKRYLYKYKHRSDAEILREALCGFYPQDPQTQQMLEQMSGDMAEEAWPGELAERQEFERIMTGVFDTK